MRQDRQYPVAHGINARFAPGAEIEDAARDFARPRSDAEARPRQRKMPQFSATTPRSELARHSAQEGPKGMTGSQRDIRTAWCSQRRPAAPRRPAPPERARRSIAVKTPPLLRRALAPAAVVLALICSADAAELPLTRVVLSSSGLAQFTHAGPVTGGSSIELPVRLDQVDDILKSLTIFDEAGRDRYRQPARQDAAGRTVPRPAVRAGCAQFADDLLNALVGTEVEITGQVGAKGRIFRVENGGGRAPEQRRHHARGIA